MSSDRVKYFHSSLFYLSVVFSDQMSGTDDSSEHSELDSVISDSKENITNQYVEQSFGNQNNIGRLNIMIKDNVIF